MDARERLRRYLEQRRDAGERELLLDSMTVDEVMRIVAGLPHMPDSPTITEPAAAQKRPPRAAPPVPMPPPVAPLETAAAENRDWRSVLAAAAGEVAVPRPVERLADTKPTAGQPPPADAPPASGSGQRWPAGLVFGRAGVDLFGGPLASYRTLEDVARAVASCAACPLYGTATHPVPGEGSPTASLVCVGEAPGATEDETGRPFVGAAGKLLDKILAAIDLARESVFICNVLKHRPPGNRNPLPAEVVACTPYLVRQLELIRPRVILAFGAFAAQTLLETTQPIGKLRGAVHRYYGVPLIATYHPAALLRNPAWKRPTWENVQYARRILNGTGV